MRARTRLLLQVLCVLGGIALFILSKPSLDFSSVSLLRSLLLIGALVLFQVARLLQSDKG